MNGSFAQSIHAIDFRPLLWLYDELEDTASLLQSPYTMDVVAFGESPDKLKALTAAEIELFNPGYGTSSLIWIPNYDLPDAYEKPIFRQYPKANVTQATLEKSSNIFHSRQVSFSAHEYGYNSTSISWVCHVGSPCDQSFPARLGVNHAEIYLQIRVTSKAQGSYCKFENTFIVRLSGIPLGNTIKYICMYICKCNLP